MNKNTKTVLPNKAYFYVALYAFLFSFGIVTKDSVVGLLLTVPQVLIIVYLLLRKEYYKATFCHLLFIVLGLDSTTSLLTISGDEFSMYSYAKIKLVGPIGLNHLIGGLIWWRVRLKFPEFYLKKSLFYHFYKLIILLAIGGVSIGIIGIVFWGYPIQYFIKPVVYILNAYIYIDILLRLYSLNYSKKYYFHIIYLIIAAPLAAAFCFHLLGVHSTYSTEEALVYNEMYLLSPCLLIAFLQVSNKRILILFSLGCYCLNLIAGARGSHFIIFIVAVIFFLYQLYFNSGSRALRLGLPVIIFCLVLTLSGVFSTASHLSTVKFREVLALTNIFWGEGNFMIRIQEIPESPLTRIAEVLNILHNGFTNPLGLIFGKGYGGHFTDSLGLFNGLTLMGGYSDDVIASGKFTTAHSVYPTALLYNGIIGLFLLVRMGVKYLRNMKHTFLTFAALVLFLYGFYYNSIILLCCIFMLYAAEYKLQQV